MEETSFQLQVGDGILSGHAGGAGIPALLLHGGPGLSDYTAGCAAEIGRLFTTMRYTQRGVPPSTVGAPFTVESHYFADPAGAPPYPDLARGVECSLETNRSISEHFERGTLLQGLRRLRGLPVLFVHGVRDPLPLRASLETARLIRGARVARVAECGHFPWLERPGLLDRMLRGLFAQL